MSLRYTGPTFAKSHEWGPLVWGVTSVGVEIDGEANRQSSYQIALVFTKRVSLQLMLITFDKP